MTEKVFMYNLKTGETDHRLYPETDEEAVQYLPQDVAAQMLYKCHRALERSVRESSCRVLMSCLGMEWPENPIKSKYQVDDRFYHDGAVSKIVEITQDRDGVARYRFENDRTVFSEAEIDAYKPIVASEGREFEWPVKTKL